MSSLVDRILSMFRGSKKDEEPEEDEVQMSEREEDHADVHAYEEEQAPEPSRVYE